ncbi:hypothetical protein MHYP_G00364050 [Metynnis hypsauchen]
MPTDREHQRQLQLDDPVTGKLLRDVENVASDEIERDKTHKYTVQDGLLYYCDPKASCVLHPMKQLKFFAPLSLRTALLQYYHDHTTAGHLGATKTLARLRLRFFWPKMPGDVKRYVASCTVCQLSKPSQRKPAGLMIPICPSKPWEYTGVDFVGPLPRTPCGNTYILIFVDYFSKWVEVSAVKEATAQTAANKFMSEVFARHGTPSYLISDRGFPFISDFFKHVVSALGTEHRLTTAYHPQTNATERGWTLKTAIRSYVGDKHTSWDKYIPQICFALRTAPHESTGHSPSLMLYGRELDTPLDLLTQPSPEGMDEPDIPYPENLRASIREAHDHAHAALEASHVRRKHYYDKRRREVSYQVDDLVKVKTHPRSDALANFTAKLAPVYSGPFRVSEKLSDVNYRLTRVDTNEDAGVFHVVNVQPFHTWDSSDPSRNSRYSPREGETSGDPDVLTHSSLSDLDGQPFDMPVDSDSQECASDDVVHVQDWPKTDADYTDCRGQNTNLEDFEHANRRYSLRQRHVPRVTSGWSRTKWTNPYHTQRLVQPVKVQCTSACRRKMDSTGIPTPRMDWDSSNLPDAWRKFRQHVELMFSGPLASKKEEERCSYLLLWVGEKGRDVFNTWTLTADERKLLTTYYDRFETYVTPKANPIFARYKFHEKIQGNSESFDQFMTELRLLAKDCGYPNGDEMVRDRIVFGINSPRIREKLLCYGSGLTLENAIDIARSHE